MFPFIAYILILIYSFQHIRFKPGAVIPNGNIDPVISGGYVYPDPKERNQADIVLHTVFRKGLQNHRKYHLPFHPFFRIQFKFHFILIPDLLYLDIVFHTLDLFPEQDEGSLFSKEITEIGSRGHGKLLNGSKILKLCQTVNQI